MLERYGRAAQAVLQGSAVPYGYTITVWSSGAMVMHRHGSPKPGLVFLFAAGAVAGFAVLATVAHAAAVEPLQPQARDLLVTGVAHVVAVGAAIGAATLVAPLPGGVAWPLAAFLATAVYLALVSLELLVAARTRRAG
jgi:hypothetical protein